MVSAGEVMSTVEEHDCGWGVLRLRVNGWIVLTGSVSSGEAVGQGIGL
jgi:hypothetical protein